MMKSSYILIFLTLIFFTASFSEKHPYHVGSVEINHNKTSKTFEITGRFFMDDLENALGKKYGKPFHFNDDKFKVQLNDALKNYSAEYLKLKSDGKFLKINYIGYEEDHESVNVYMETESVEKPKKVEAAVSFLYNYFDDQINIVHLIINRNRKSEKLSYPNRYMFGNF